MSGQLVREARRRAGLTQAELAERAGTTQSAIARLETGRSTPSLRSLRALVAAAGYRVDLRLVPADDHEWSMAERNLTLSPSERVANMLAAVRFAEAGRAAKATRDD